MKKTKKNPFQVQPGLYAACVELASDPAAGGLLCQIVLLSMGKTLKDHNGETGWLCLSRAQWRILTSFTRSQHDRAVSILKEKGLIESYRRKLRYADPAALAWVRITEKTKSGIAEIKKRDGISAFAESTADFISVISENDGVLISDGADSLKEMNKPKNEKEENVIVEKTITETAISYQKGVQKKDKGKSADKIWFQKFQDQIYEGSHFTPEPYQSSASETLRDIVEWLVTNPGKFQSACKGYPDPVKGALTAVVRYWPHFCVLSGRLYKTYGQSPVPQIWSLKHQHKAIPDYIKFLGYFREIQAGAGKAGYEIPKDEDQGGHMDGYLSWLDTPEDKKSVVFLRAVEKLKPSEGTAKFKNKNSGSDY